MDIAGDVRVVAVSMWSNRPCEEIAYLSTLGRCDNPTAFSIAYPHWGYELEMFPRPEIVRAGGDLLQTYGAVLGHHSHVPQPLTAIRNVDTSQQLLAFSLGNFCTGMRIKKFQYGVACRLDIGPGEDRIWRIGAVRWHYTRVLPDTYKSMKVVFVSDMSL